ncbi:hypothetical protein E8E13_006600 [Curvularia kusanoi]|uniref:Uncharacterized protein n=1 Tax=Curvularia kusanoi TaxID=90978 RepID=A0A9P4W9P7_CURKU|nr:hypothetical protein E8E13_006600 [Curvularia kusanoi]
MAVACALYLLALSGWGSASLIRKYPHAEDSVSGSDEVLSSPSTLSVYTGATQAASPNSYEASTAGSQTSQKPPSNSKVHVESSVAGLETLYPTTTAARDTPVSGSTVDIGTIIVTLLPPTFSGTYAAPTVHTEITRSGLETTQGPPVIVTSRKSETVASEIGHFEITRTGWGSQYQPGPPPTRTLEYQQPPTQNPQNPPSTQTPQYGPGKPGPKDPQPTQQPEPEPKGDQPPVTTAPGRLVTEYPPPPALTHDGITVQPTAVTQKSTLTLPGGAVTTTEQVEFQLAVGSSTLSIGTPITINNVAITLTTNSAGSTVLQAGDTTTTLPAPTPGVVRTVAADTPGRLNIVTAVIDGTTKYIFQGQTLAPGQPVTIGNLPISIATGAGNTVLFVGDKSTTLPAGGSNIKTLAGSPSSTVGVQGTGTNTDSAGATSTATKKSGSSLTRRADGILAYLILGIGLMITA